MKRGFTLIELLVVVSIIGTLSSIVISNTISARNKANDNAIKAEMIQLNKAMTDYFIANNLVPVDTFASCAGCTMNLVQDTSVDNPTGDATVQSVLNKFKDYTKNVPYYLNPSINVRGFFGWYAPHAGYVMWAVSKSGTYFCIDSTTQRVYDKGTSAGIFWTCN